MAINRLLCGVLAVVQLAGTSIAVGQTGTGLGASRQASVLHANHNQATVSRKDVTTPSLTISVRTLDFGAVPVDSINEVSFMVQNVGAGILTGTAEVSQPFSVLGGSPFVLKPAETQIITIRYVPGSQGMHMTVVHLTGGEGASITVMGSAAPHKPATPARRPRAPTQPKGLRLIAQR